MGSCPGRDSGVTGQSMSRCVIMFKESLIVYILVYCLYAPSNIKMAMTTGVRRMCNKDPFFWCLFELPAILRLLGTAYNILHDSPGLGKLLVVPIHSRFRSVLQDIVVLSTAIIELSFIIYTCHEDCLLAPHFVLIFTRRPPTRSCSGVSCSARYQIWRQMRWYLWS